MSSDVSHFEKGVVFALLGVLGPFVMADVPLPPSPLHRVGYEVLPTELSRSCVVSGYVGEVLFAVCFIVAIVLFVLRDFASMKYGRIWRNVFIGCLAGLILGGTFAYCFSTAGTIWKYPSQVLPWEENALQARMSLKQHELQKRFDAEYARMDAAGELERVEPPTGAISYRHHRYVQETMERNAQAVVKRVLEKDPELKSHYKGVPIEWIANGMRCPLPTTIAEDGNTKDEASIHPAADDMWRNRKK